VNVTISRVQFYLASICPKMRRVRRIVVGFKGKPILAEVCITMWSLRQTLATLAVYPPNSIDHLPDGFDAANGIRVLFPANQTIGISALSNYVFSFEGTAQTPGGNSAQMAIIADGAGRWNLAIVPDLSPLVIGWAAGFVFTYSAPNDGYGHGYVVSTVDLSGNARDVGGVVDPWLLENWPQAFVQTAYLWIWDLTAYFITAFTQAQPAPIEDAATSYGFTGLAPLNVSYSEELPYGYYGEDPGGAYQVGGHESPGAGYSYVTPTPSSATNP